MGNACVGVGIVRQLRSSTDAILRTHARMVPLSAQRRNCKRHFRPSGFLFQATTTTLGCPSDELDLMRGKAKLLLETIRSVLRARLANLHWLRAEKGQTHFRAVRSEAEKISGKTEAAHVPLTQFYPLGYLPRSPVIALQRTDAVDEIEDAEAPRFHLNPRRSTWPA